MGIGLGLKAPVARAAQIGRPKGRVEHAFRLVIAARFDEQHLAVGVLGETTGDDRAGRSAAADDEVIRLLQVRVKPVLVLARATLEIGDVGWVRLMGHDYIL